MYIVLWSGLPDEREHLVGPFPTNLDAEIWAAKYLGDNDSEVCWNVRKLTLPAQYPALEVAKHSVDYNGADQLAALERQMRQNNEDAYTKFLASK